MFIDSEPTKNYVELILVGDGEIDRTLWNIFRLTIHNMEHEDNGMMRYYEVHKV